MYCDFDGLSLKNRSKGLHYSIAELVRIRLLRLTSHFILVLLRALWHIVINDGLVTGNDMSVGCCVRKTHFYP